MAEVRGYEWLPDGWKVEVRVRKSGRKDRYYTDPASGYVFRSLKDIDRYLLTGKCERRAMKSKSNDVDEAPERVLKGVRKPRSSRAGKKKPVYRGTNSNLKLKSPQTKGSDDVFVSESDQVGLLNAAEMIDSVTCEHDENTTCLSAQEIAVLLGRQTAAHENGPSVGEESRSMGSKTETGLDSSVALPWEVICSDPCIEFAIKTLTGAIPLEGRSGGMITAANEEHPDFVQGKN